MKIIELKNIFKKYGKYTVLNDVNLYFENGLCYMIVGGNGSGKSTLIKIILNLVKPNSGELLISNLSFGYVPEKYTLAEYMTIYDFLIMMGLLRGINKDNLNYKIDELLKYWEIYDYRFKRMKELSKGMMQKVVIIQALIHNPDVYIFDEALNGLDPSMQEKLLSIINCEKKKGKLIIITSHYPKLYSKTVDRIITIENGKVKVDENY